MAAGNLSRLEGSVRVVLWALAVTVAGVGCGSGSPTTCLPDAANATEVAAEVAAETPTGETMEAPQADGGDAAEALTDAASDATDATTSIDVLAEAPSSDGSGDADASSQDAPADAADAPSPAAALDAATDQPVAMDSGADVADESPAKSIRDQPGLVLWLRADTGVEMEAGHVLFWPDQSGRHNDARQPVVSQGPTFLPEGIGKKPSLRFDASGTSLRVADSASMQWGTDDFVLLTVVSVVGLDMEGLFVKAVVIPPYDGINFYTNRPLPGQVYTYLGPAQELASVSTTYSDGTPHVVATRRSKGKIELRIDGEVVSFASSLNIDVSAAGADMVIGAGAVPNYYLRGQMAEVVAIRGNLSAEDLSAVEREMAARYGL